MGPSVKYFKAYGRAYVLYIMLKWTTIGGSFLVLSRFDGFTWAWMLWWPFFGAPIAISYNIHRFHQKKFYW